MSVQLLKDTEKQIRQVNKFRLEIGLRPIEFVKRKCLRCDREFTALGNNTRTCGCRKN